ncbi:MAG: nitrilase-related carbon-nitrogen hydrolase, partial [Solirubrobacterales bacterium]
SVLIDRDGRIAAAYRKIHMFDVDVEDVSYRESEAEQPGDEIDVAAAGGVPIGLSVCYDLRFPELFRILSLRGALLVTVPSAFTERTGRDHWEVLVRARAIENQVFVAAAGQIGEAPPHYRSFGRSMIVDPWGVVLAQAPDTECFVAADLDLSFQDQVRRGLPSLHNRRPGAYRWPREDGGSGLAAGIAEPATPTGAT